jgi:hypothetical protein
MSSGRWSLRFAVGGCDRVGKEKDRDSLESGEEVERAFQFSAVIKRWRGVKEKKICIG